MPDFHFRICLQLFRVGLETESYVPAYRAASAYVLAVNQPQFAATLCRMLNSLPAQLFKAIQCMDVVAELLSRDSVTSVNVGFLGHTVARHVCLALRLVVTSPRCVHLIGGCYLLLK